MFLTVICEGLEFTLARLLIWVNSSKFHGNVSIVCVRHRREFP